MNRKLRVARLLADSPLDPALRWMAAKLTRYVDIADNFNDADPDTNGEMFVVKKAAPHWRLALDVGANVGEWSDAVVKANGACKVHAFEPSPTTFEILKRNLSSAKSVSFHNVGVGAGPGTLRFHDHGAGSGMSGFVSREGTVGLEAQRIIELPVVALDDLLDKERLDVVDFVKIDTEGFEMPVIRGLKGALAKRRVAAVQFEYGGTWLDAHETLHDAIELLREVRCEVYQVMPNGLRAVSYDPAKHETFKYANFVAVADAAKVASWGIFAGGAR